MTVTEPTPGAPIVDATDRVAYEAHVPEIMRHLLAVEAEIARSTLDVGLVHLVKLRASQINGCAFCVRMHAAEARRDGETDDRLDHLVVWHHTDDYSAAEKAAFAWTEALTEPDGAADHGRLRAALREHFDDTAISYLTAAVAMINLWNRVQISHH
ncbi:MAG: carboxymuconolactone decarboxylase family protein [Actinomycetota bacterium]|nr:carboxymuconolactone decarboxylase family protein [Actinomycetota bacterium]